MHAISLHLILYAFEKTLIRWELNFNKFKPNTPLLSLNLVLVWRYSQVLRLLLPAYCSILLYTVDQCSTVQNDSGSGQNALTNRWSRRSYDLRLRWLLSEPYNKQALRVLHISKNADAYYSVPYKESTWEACWSNILNFDYVCRKYVQYLYL
jgi:hypothetical protein